MTRGASVSLVEMGRIELPSAIGELHDTVQLTSLEVSLHLACIHFQGGIHKTFGSDRD